MVEPFRSDPVEDLSKFVRTIPSLVRHREGYPWLRTILPKRRSTPLRQVFQEEPIKGSRLAGSLRVLATDLAETHRTSLTLAAVRYGILVNLQPLYFSDTA